MALLLPTVAVEEFAGCHTGYADRIGVDTILWMWTIRWLITVLRSLSRNG